jgi:thiamine pyrophosphate-dependent acetolactate synthase large subunit-like protein
MQVREAFPRFLEARGIRTIFHLPGIHTLPLNDALLHSTIRVFLARHELNAAFMADGFSRSTGKVGVVFVSPGPGLGNVVSSCMEAYGDDIPLLIVYVGVDKRGAEKGGLHGVGDAGTLFEGIAKGNFAVTDAADFWRTMEHAYSCAASPRQGPVIVSVPYRVMQRECPENHDEHASPDTSDGEAVDSIRLESVVGNAERPVIIAGKSLGQSADREELWNLCERARIPVLTSTSGKGLLPDNHRSSFGHIASGTARTILEETDLVVALGTRLRRVDTKERGIKFTSPLVHVDVDGRWLNKNYSADLAVAGDVDGVVQALLSLWCGRRFDWDLVTLNEQRKKEATFLEAHQPGMQITMLLRRMIPFNTTTVWDPTLLGYWAEERFSVFQERTFLYPSGTSSIFYALPASVGAKIGCPDRPCLCVTGDGSFLAGASELATIKSYGVPVVILVYNNKSFGILEHFMRERYQARNAMTLDDPDFVAISRAFGIDAERVESIDGLEWIFRNRITWDKPFVVELSFPLFSPPW